MAKLYFRYGTMYSGKSGDLISIATNYKVQGKQVITLSPSIDTRPNAVKGYIASRSGAKIPTRRFSTEDNLFKILSEYKQIWCVLIDEAQFMTEKQVQQVTDIVDVLDIPVIAFGLKNDFQNKLFEGSQALLVYADTIEEIKTVCWYCNHKATMVVRLDPEGKAITQGEQIMIDTQVLYRPVCRKCYKKLTQKRGDLYE